MNHIYIASTSIHSLGYSPGKRVLEVRFKHSNGGESAYYRYPDVACGDVTHLLFGSHADSIGKRFAQFKLRFTRYTMHHETMEDGE